MEKSETAAERCAREKKVKQLPRQEDMEASAAAKELLDKAAAAAKEESKGAGLRRTGTNGQSRGEKKMGTGRASESDKDLLQEALTRELAAHTALGDEKARKAMAKIEKAARNKRAADEAEALKKCVQRRN